MDIYFSQLRYWKPKTKVEIGSLSGLQLSAFLLYPHVVERASSGLFFFYEAPLPRPHLSLTTSWWLHLVTITLGVGLQPMKLRGHTSSPGQPRSALRLPSSWHQGLAVRPRSTQQAENKARRTPPLSCARARGAHEHPPWFPPSDSEGS